MEPALQLDAVLALLLAGETLLVPTQEAARDLRQHFDLRQQSLGQGAWEPPRLLAWSQWLEALWDSLTLEGTEQRVLLNRLQEEILWAELAPSAGLGTLPSSTLRSLARQASSALTLAASFLAVDRLSAAADTPDAHAFAAWQGAFKIHCRSNLLLSRASLTQALTEHLQLHHLTLPPTLHLLGFEQLDPSQSTFLDSLELSGTAVHHHTLRQPAAPVPLGSCVIPGDPQAELRWAVLWLRHALAAHPDSAHPVALVCPDPERERPRLEPLLRELMAPELEPVEQDLSSAPWHFSTGPSLASQTVIAHALQLLRWTQNELSTEAIGTLLLSPYLAHADPFELRARFDTQILRRSPLLRPEMTLAVFLKSAARTSSTEARHLGGTLTLPEWRSLQTLLDRGSRSTATHGEWAEYIRRVLATTGWPGPRTLSPAEFRHIEAWNSALDLLSTLDLHGTRPALPEFLSLLTSELQRLQVKGVNPGAIIQVLRPAETVGRLFHAALVLGATDTAWPPPESAQPLLGWALAKTLGMPGTSASQTHERSLARLRDLAARCSALLLTVADHDAGGPLRLTELSGELSIPPLPPETLLAPLPDPVPLVTQVAFEEVALPALPSRRIAGGARVLELQASCGFRAFASLRLGASMPETQNLGGDARGSGQDVHKALEIFWEKMHSRQALDALTPAQRHQAVSSAVEAALAGKRGQPHGDTWTEAYLDVAGRRLTHLMMDWLETELHRGDFTVLQQEEKQLISVGPLELSIRPDRVDEVGAGLVFVDYKTSQALSAQDWLGDRPLSPQLPLYALLAEPDEVRGLAFGRVRPGGDMGWISLQAEAGLFPRKGSTSAGDFAEQVALWRTELARLAEEFAAGSAFVDPKSFPKTCEFCQQRLLCRLDPADLLAAGNGTAPAPESEQEDDPAR